jgi:hypothetical protein
VVRRVRVRSGARNSIVNLIFTIKLSSFVENNNSLISRYRKKFEGDKSKYPSK